MTTHPLSPPPFSQPLTDRDGLMARVWQAWFAAMFNRSGGATDKIEAAHAAALAAVPQTTEVVAGSGLHAGGALGGNIAVALYRRIGTAASFPTKGNSPGDLCYALDGRKPGEGAGAGTGVPCFWTPGAVVGTWIAVTSGVAVTV